MNLSVRKLEDFWKKADQVIGNQPLPPSVRFKEVMDLAAELESLPNGNSFGSNPSPFGPAIDGVVTDESAAGLANMRAKFQGQIREVDASYKLLGAFPGKRKSDYRVFSNAKSTTEGETETVTVCVNVPDYYFASNNYFFVVADFLKRAKGKFAFNSIVEEGLAGSMVSGYEDNGARDIKKHHGILRVKFVTKYLWMLANRDALVHVVSLQSFWNLMKSDLLATVMGVKESRPESNCDADFDRFVEFWKDFNKSLLASLKIGERAVADIRKLSELLFTLSLKDAEIRDMRQLLKTGNQAVILWGPPGTGKTYAAKVLVEQELGLSKAQLPKHRFSALPTVEFERESGISGPGCYELVQFHPSYSYEDFIGGIRPRVEGGNVSYELHQGIFKRFCDTARKSEGQGKPFFFIIDEINRADLSAVFGELLYSLEYRGEPIRLQGFDDTFIIPNNVYLIGTMNNIDKSLVSFDFALRRRFGFFKLMPNLDTLEDMPELERIKPDSLRDYVDRCKKLNDSIGTCLGLGQDYQIGQAYFKNIADFLPSVESACTEISLKREIENNYVQIGSYDLERLWTYHICPLLEEYLGVKGTVDEIDKVLQDLKTEFTTLPP